MTGRDEPPAGAAADADTSVPAGFHGEGAAQRDEWARMQASYRRGKRGDRWRRRAARGTLPARAGMNRRMPEPPAGDDAA